MNSDESANEIDSGSGSDTDSGSASEADSAGASGTESSSGSEKGSRRKRSRLLSIDSDYPCKLCINSILYKKPAMKNARFNKYKCSFISMSYLISLIPD
jgi:hypothetical protein